MVVKVKKLAGLRAVKGLIGSNEPLSAYFETRWGIHTFFMKFPIDVLVLDSQNRVVYLQEGLKPNRIFFWSPLYCRVLELPSGTIEVNKFSKGVKIDLAFS